MVSSIQRGFSLDDAPRSGCPMDFDEERLQTLLCEDSRQTTRVDRAAELCILDSSQPS